MDIKFSNEPGARFALREFWMQENEGHDDRRQAELATVLRRAQGIADQFGLQWRVKSERHHVVSVANTQVDVVVGHAGIRLFPWSNHSAAQAAVYADSQHASRYRPPDAPFQALDLDYDFPSAEVLGKPFLDPAGKPVRDMSAHGAPIIYRSPVEMLVEAVIGHLTPSRRSLSV